MTQMRNVLCPVDFSALSADSINVAIEVCRAYGGRLLLHHNLAAVQPGMARAWEWNELHPGPISELDAEARLRGLVEHLSRTVAVEASMSAGPLGPVLLELAEQLPADLLVLGNHGLSSADHASLTERLIERSPCPVLTLHDGALSAAFNLRGTGCGRSPVIVPTDFSRSAANALAYAFDMARHLPVDLHLLHVLPQGASLAQVEAAAAELSGYIPEDLSCLLAHGHVEVGDPAVMIGELARRLNAACIVMGEHARGVWRKLFTHDTARDVMHRAPCPVWFVPAGAGMSRLKAVA